MFTAQRIRGTLKVKIVRGYNLAVRDIRNSDPYVVVQHAGSVLNPTILNQFRSFSVFQFVCAFGPGVEDKCNKEELESGVERKLDLQHRKPHRAHSNCT